MIKYFLLLFFFLQFFPVNTNAEEHLKGELIEKIICDKDKKQAYALFLPSNYDENQIFPILYIFEPAARAKLGIQVFQKAAEKYGYILACSYNSRNGPMPPIVEAFNAMSEDVGHQFKIDKDRIYMAGFSGGARVATQFAMESGSIAGVIACGAGFPDGIPPKQHFDFLLMGLVGNTDMNFSEMNSMEKVVKKHQFREELIVFEGGHQWGDTVTVDLAFQWIELEEMKAEKIGMNQLLIQDFIAQNETLIAATSNDFQKLQYVHLLRDGLEGLQETTDYQKQVTELEEKEAVKKRQIERAEVLEQEKAFREKFVKEFYAISTSPFNGDSTLKNSAWWKREARILNKMRQEGEHEEEKWMAARVIDFVWRNAYIQFNRFQQGGTPQDLELARKYVSVWGYMQDIPAPHYLLAKLYAQQNKKKLAIKTLELAVEKGFKKWEYLEQDAGFEGIREMKKFKELKKKATQ